LYGTSGRIDYATLLDESAIFLFYYLIVKYSFEIAVVVSTFTFIDLFAGIGGMRIAFQNVGGQCVFSSEINKFACKTYSENFGDEPAGDITKVDEKSVPDHDILIAGFPCQPFSISGVSKLQSLKMAHGFQNETKGTLFFDAARIINEKRPKMFLLENVKNLISHNKGDTFQVIYHVLSDELGYDIHYKIIDARLLVPQHRERIYIVGFKKPVKFEFPNIPDMNPKLSSILEKNPGNKYTLTDHLWEYLQQYKKKHETLGNGFGFGLVETNGISRTLSARYYKDGSEILIPQKGKNPRRLTPRECARLMGYPDSYKIPVSDSQAYKQFGNSVAVPIVQKVAESMVSWL
jgi:DNA (cytosine-5)-methyltransferase 1